MDLTQCPLLLAVDLEGPPPLQSHRLDPNQASALGDAVAVDLARLLPGVDRFGLVLLGALYDQAEILRPGFPLLAAATELWQQAVGDEFKPSILSFGARNGRMLRAQLEPDLALAGGPFLVLPMVLLGEAGEARELGARMERVLLDQGEASRALISLLSGCMDAEIAHARYMTLNDLCALCSIQLGHQGHEGLWDLIERALWAPGREAQIVDASGRAWCLGADARVRVRAQSLAEWRRDWEGEPESAADAYVQHVLEERQRAAGLEAHGIEVCFTRGDVELPDHWLAVPAAADAEPRQSQPRSGPALLVPRHPQLGPLAACVVEAHSGRLLGEGYALRAQAWPSLLNALQRAFPGLPEVPQMLPFRLDASGTGFDLSASAGRP